jgi:hypothetical protein
MDLHSDDSGHGLEQVCFELLDFSAATRLVRRLGAERSAALLFDEPYVVVASFQPEASDLAKLLRDVEAWVAEESLRAIRYMLDGRIYVLEAGEPDWGALPWEPEPSEERAA